MELELVTVLVGSHAHGLATAKSDRDLRGVYAARTRDLLAVGRPKVRETRWVEGATEDDTSWELGKFLTMAIHCDPNVIEVFVAPVERKSPWSHELRKLLPAVASTVKVRDAFRGYATNRLRRLLDYNLPDIQRRKGALAAIRTLMNGRDLLRDGTYKTPIEGDLRREFERLRDGDMTTSGVLAWADILNAEIDALLLRSPLAPLPDLDRVNAFMERVRSANW